MIASLAAMSADIGDDMSDADSKPDAASPAELSVRPHCSHCGFPLPASDSGLRHYGTHTAHQENECLRLLHAEIDRLRAEVAKLQEPVEDMAAWRLRFFGAVAEVGAAERERHAKQLQRWADRCDDLADHTDDHTRASLRDMAAEMRPNAELRG